MVTFGKEGPSFSGTVSLESNLEILKQQLRTAPFPDQHKAFLESLGFAGSSFMIHLSLDVVAPVQSALEDFPKI